MHRRTLLKTLGVATAFLFVSGFKGCDKEDQIRRALALLRGLSPFIISFHLATAIQTRILNAITKIVEVFEFFQANPIRGNLRAVLTLIQKFLDEDVFNTGNPKFTERLSAAIAAVVFVLNILNPPETASMGDDSNAPVTVTKAQEAIIDAKLDELENILKP